MTLAIPEERGDAPDSPRGYTTAARPLMVAHARACVIIPAYEAERTLGAVLEDVMRVLGASRDDVLVVDDGSHDETHLVASRAGVRLVRCASNGGKGGALVRGLEEALRLGFEGALTVDADGQHPARAAALVLGASTDPRALVLGVRDLARDGAPKKNRFSNGVSNLFLSLFSGRRLRDTQCGLRRYPIAETLALGTRGRGYDFEAEIILRAIARGIPIVECPVEVIYPPAGERVTHFDSVRDPMRIVRTVVRTLVDLRVTQ
jgi:glycosyltransferase involved in cell wall biosynthesis